MDSGVVVNQMRAGSGNYGLDAARCQYVDLVEAGIIDPTKVVRLALENAGSVASVLLLTEATLTEIPEPKAETNRTMDGQFARNRRGRTLCQLATHELWRSSMATPSHATMHHDHRQWLSDNNMWRCDIANWQQEFKKAAADRKQIEAALKEHEQALQVHAASIRLREQDLAAHEHALAEYEQGEAGAQLISLAQSHEKEARKHAQQRDAHERIKRHHHEVLAQINRLHKSIDSSL